MPCIIAGCGNYANHNVSIRLRRPDTSGIWAPNTSAHLCDQHATAGLRIEIILTPQQTGQIETIVHSPGGEPAQRKTPIKNEAW